MADGIELVKEIKCDGLLIDTFHKGIGKGLLDYYSLKEIKEFVDNLHNIGKEAWIAGSISKEQLPELWTTGVDVICVRGAACEKNRRQSKVWRGKESIVKELISTLPKQ